MGRKSSILGQTFACYREIRRACRDHVPQHVDDGPSHAFAWPRVPGGRRGPEPDRGRGARYRACAADGHGDDRGGCGRSGALDAALPPHAASLDRHDDRVRGFGLTTIRTRRLPAGPGFREGRSQCLFRWVVDLSLPVLQRASLRGPPRRDRLSGCVRTRSLCFPRLSWMKKEPPGF